MGKTETSEVSTRLYTVVTCDSADAATGVIYVCQDRRFALSGLVKFRHFPSTVVIVRISNHGHRLTSVDPDLFKEL